MASGSTPAMGPSTSGELLRSRMNDVHLANSSPSQRSAMKDLFSRPSVRMVWDMALMMATLVPGIRGKWKAALTWGERTESVLRGSTTINLAPLRKRFFMRDAKTGWPSVGLAPITTITSASSTERKSWVPADVPKVLERPYPVGEWQTRAQVSTLLFWNAVRIIFCTT